jgi:hypothetical protein
MTCPEGRCCMASAPIQITNETPKVAQAVKFLSNPVIPPEFTFMHLPLPRFDH